MGRVVLQKVLTRSTHLVSKAINLASRAGKKVFTKHTLPALSALGSWSNFGINWTKKTPAVQTVLATTQTCSFNSQRMPAEALSDLNLARSCQDYIAAAGVAAQYLHLLLDAAALAVIKELGDKVVCRLDGIEQNIRSLNMRGDKFPDHVYRCAKKLLRDCQDHDVDHFVAIFSPSTEWHAKFDELNENNDLGPYFLGYRTSLDELCAFLVEQVRPQIRDSAVLHIMIPSLGPLSIRNPVRFPPELSPLHLHGELGDGGSPYVWICAPDDREKFHNIGYQHPPARRAAVVEIGIPFLPPLYTGIWKYEGSHWWPSASIGTPLCAAASVPCEPEAPRMLGRPIIPDANEESDDEIVVNESESEYSEHESD